MVSEDRLLFFFELHQYPVEYKVVKRFGKEFPARASQFIRHFAFKIVPRPCSAEASAFHFYGVSLCRMEKSGVRSTAGVIAVTAAKFLFTAAKFLSTIYPYSSA